MIWILDLVCETARELYPLTDSDAPIEVAAVGIPDETEIPPKTFKGKYRSIRLQNTSSTSDRTTVRAQLEKYFSWEHGDMDIDAISFWSSNRAKLDLPILSKLALRVLCIPASSAAVERVFSHGGLAMRPNRSRMSDEHLSELILLKTNRLQFNDS